jgi:hypothetical protein
MTGAQQGRHLPGTARFKDDIRHIVIRLLPDAIFAKDVSKFRQYIIAIF